MRVLAAGLWLLLGWSALSCLSGAIWVLLGWDRPVTPTHAAVRLLLFGIGAAGGLRYGIRGEARERLRSGLAVIAGALLVLLAAEGLGFLTELFLPSPPDSRRAGLVVLYLVSPVIGGWVGMRWWRRHDAPRARPTAPLGASAYTTGARRVRRDGSGIVEHGCVAGENDSGPVDATGGWLAGAKGKIPFRASFFSQARTAR